MLVLVLLSRLEAVWEVVWADVKLRFIVFSTLYIIIIPTVKCEEGEFRPSVHWTVEWTSLTFSVDLT